MSGVFEGVKEVLDQVEKQWGIRGHRDAEDVEHIEMSQTMAKWVGVVVGNTNSWSAVTASAATDVSAMVRARYPRNTSLRSKCWWMSAI